MRFLTPLPRLAAIALAAIASAFAAQNPLVPVGVARVDITPELPIRLSGYGNRETEAKQVGRQIFARALAIGSDAQQPVLLITVELVGIPEAIRDAVVDALHATRPIDRAHLAITATHTHCGPSVKGLLPYMFAQDVPDDQQQRIDRYSTVLQAKLVEVGLAALADRRPARLDWAEGTADFASHRRVVVKGKWTGFGRDPKGPVDRALPLLRVTDEAGALRAIYVSYACHCTTLTGNDNFVHGDWAGDASGRIETAHPGTVALVSLGCGGDANPQTRGTLEQVASHGQAIAAEVARLLGGPMQPLGPVTRANYRRIELNLDHAVTREELQARADQAQKAPPKYFAGKFLAQLDAGRPLPVRVPYPIVTWTFGDSLAMVFLAGEVVSEYSLRLRRELDASRLWVNAYSNSVPCYIPSKRMYPEGGYEVDGSMDYYGWPTRLGSDTEERIIGTVRELVPPAFARRSN